MLIIVYDLIQFLLLLFQYGVVVGLGGRCSRCPEAKAPTTCFGLLSLDLGLLFLLFLLGGFLLLEFRTRPRAEVSEILVAVFRFVLVKLRSVLGVGKSVV